MTNQARKQTLSLMQNRIDTIIGSRGKVIDRYESQALRVKDVMDYLSELGYEPISKAEILGIDKYFVYLINGEKYILKKELDGVSFYPRGY